MTDLRDARLQQALAHAPDVQALPAAGTRIAIKNIANNAISTRVMAELDTEKPWWKTLWTRSGRAGRSGRASGPWNAGFATLLLGGIIALIWHGQEVPDAVLDERPDAVPSAPGVALPVVKAPAAAGAPQASVPAPAADPELSKSRTSSKRDQDAADSLAAASAATPPPVTAVPIAAPSVRLEAPSREKRALPPAIAMNADKSLAEKAAGLPKYEVQDRAAAPVLTDSAASINRNPIASNQSPTLQVGEWMWADVFHQGRTARLAKRDVQALVNHALTVGVANVGSRAAPKEAQGLDGTPLLRLQLMDKNNAVAQFEMWGAAFRWQRVGQADVLGSLTPEVVASLLAAVARALPP